jgi:uncharacterized protein
MTDNAIAKKKAALEEILSGFGSLLVAFSGGVDSTLLLAMAARVLKERTVAVTFASPIHPERETGATVQMADTLGVSHRLITSKALSPPELVENTRERCYHCKKALGEKLHEIARELGIPTIAHGANLDDLDDFRPGFRAARELGLVAPLMDAGLTKADIRQLSKQMGLPTWNKPALACLATRIPYNTPLTPEALRKIDAAETAILDQGITACRVRYYGEMARIELPPEDLDRMMKKTLRKKITGRLRDIGFLHVALDLEGYTQGKMNRQ